MKERFRNISLFFLLASIITERGIAQDRFTEAFLLPLRTNHFYLPSNTGIEHDVQSNLTYKTYLGKLSVIRTYYADLHICLQKKENITQETKRQFLGFGFYSDREGEFFTKSRGLVRYALHVPLNDQWTIVGGTALHLVNYYFHASGAGASGGATKWSGTASTTLYSPTFRLGISLNDFNNPRLRPISYDFLIKRYLTLYVEKTVDLSTNTQCKGAIRTSWEPRTPPSSVFQLGFIFSETAALYGFISVNKGWGMAVEVHRIKIARNNLDLSFTYQLPKATTYPSVSQYELNLCYYLQHE